MVSVPLMPFPPDRPHTWLYVAYHTWVCKDCCRVLNDNSREEGLRCKTFELVTYALQSVARQR